MPGGLHPPLSVLATWPPQSPNPEKRGWQVPIVMVVLYTTALLFVTLRLWARLIIQRNYGLDDLFIVLAMIPLLGLMVSIFGAFRIWGYDRHAWDLGLDGKLAITSRKIAIAIETLSMISTGLTKISILLFYRRLTSGTVSSTFRWALRLAIAFVTLSTIAFTMAIYLGCRPFNSFWNQVSFPWLATHIAGRDYQCFNEAADLLAASVVSIVQDFIACLMPTVLFWKLQLPKRQKIALASLFVVGFFTCICCIMRIIYIYDIFFLTYDVTWAAGPAWMWTGIEACMGVICASVPALKVFFQKFFSASLASSFGRSHGSEPARESHKASWVGHIREKPRTPMGLRSKTFSTTTTANDLELGTIAVTQEIEVASAYNQSRENVQSGLTTNLGTRISDSSIKPLNRDTYKHNFDTSWFDLDAHEPPSPENSKRRRPGAII